MIGFRVVLGELPKTAPLPRLTPPLNAREVSQADPPQVQHVIEPFFSGPKPFVKIPPNLAGPLFSNHNHSPAIAECSNGDLLAVWFSCGDEGGPELAVLASRLCRGATEWEEASPFWDGPDINDHAPKLWFDGQKTLFFLPRHCRATRCALRPTAARLGRRRSSSSPKRRSATNRFAPAKVSSCFHSMATSPARA
jgi:hypothetical protein